MKYLGDFIADAVIPFSWQTVDSSGQSVNRTTDGEIKVMKLDSSQTDCTGGSVTDNEGSPAIGLHEGYIDSNDNIDFEPGFDYIIWLDGAVIDGQTVNAILAQFSIENRIMSAIKRKTDAI